MQSKQLRSNPFFWLVRGVMTKHITQAEATQYTDWYIGLGILNEGPPYPHSLRRLWAKLWIPLGIERGKR